MVNANAIEAGATLIYTTHLKFPRLLGENKTVITDDNRNQWALCVDFKLNEVNLWRLEDCIMKEGGILSYINQFQGMHKILKNTLIIT